MTHCPTGPSGRYRWNRYACPGSVRLIQELGVESTSSAEANEGTAAHELAALCLVSGQEARDHLGRVIEKTGHTVTEDMVAAVQVYLDWARALPGERAVEQGLEMAPIWGTPDLVVNDWPSSLTIADYKHGAGVYVEVEDNLQLQAYAVMAAEVLDPDHGWDEVRLAIVQPRYDSEAPVRQYIAPATILRAWRESLLLDLQVVQDPQAPLNPGDEQCRWCPAKPQCPARQAIVAEATQAMGLAPVETLGMDRVAWLLRHSKLIRDYLDEVYAYAAQSAEAGVEVPGFKRVQALGNRAWADEDAARRALKRQKLKLDELMPRALVSPARAEKLVGKAVVDPLCVRPTSVKLVPESDKRVALPPVNLLEMLP